ncbi:hypothetical protein BD324DRAFT_575172 [Kockovaella imperatae]|uniref:Rho GTPase activation protein n=1 Tax=Kockovaella imperatae TaxID=4999 RepID=A0A1Y1USQ8_9TREE|nr:hypothetical protein BD324DRAFT_575172 [Kockovaella imperatae]ORX41049.1 hypothetical protein BD324DRAFT_575172 [Kockovaella imperatae]
MDIRDALAKCEDPTLGWSLQFWVTIADPQTQNVFFACPATGQCSWDPPIGAMIVPRMPEGEWWELADASRGNRCYYYNTVTSKTQWSRPKDGAFVIPLGLIQRNALPKKPNHSSGHLERSPDPFGDSIDQTPPNRPTKSRAPASPPVRPERQSSPQRPFPNSHPTEPPLSPRRSVPPSPSPNTSSDNTEHLSEDPVDHGFPSEPSQSTVASSSILRTPLSVVYESAPKETEANDPGSPTKGANGYAAVSRDLWSGKDRSAHEDRDKGRQASLEISPPIVTDGTIPRQPEITEPIQVSAMRTKRLSTGLHPLLPTSISDEIQAFQKEDFASKYFAVKRSGMLRSRVPFDEIMQWQKQPISAPLLVISRSLTKDAIITFKVIQHVMGERDRPVEHAKPSPSTANAINAASASKVRAKKDTGAYLVKMPALAFSRGNGSKPDMSIAQNVNGHSKVHGVEVQDDKTIVLEEIRWVLQLAVGTGEMRDEVYSQLVKQLTRNPHQNAMIMGFQLFCILVNSFTPSKNFEPFVKRFLENDARGTDGISRMAQYCLTRLQYMTKRGSRCKTLTIGEIEHAADAAFYPSVYGESLDQIMALQAPTYPDLQIPVILPFLSDGILALGGLEQEGIFRVPGDNDSVSELKSRMDRGHYVLSGIDDPHVTASLLKLWLRDLRDPVIPEDMYDDALIASKTPSQTLAFIDRLPLLNRRVLMFVISFFQLFLNPEVIDKTKMTIVNLSLVLAPNLLRTTSDQLVTVFTNSAFESKFALHLLEHLDTQSADPEYRPVHGDA